MNSQCGSKVVTLTMEEYDDKYGSDAPLLRLEIEEYSDIAIVRHSVDNFLEERFLSWNNPFRKRVLLGLTECVTNVVKHTSGGYVLVFLEEEGPCFHVIDRGSGLVCHGLLCQTFTKGFSTVGTLGLGFSIMQKYFESIEVCTSSRGTKFVLHSDYKAHNVKI